jgi:hypothetical protein
MKTEPAKEQKPTEAELKAFQEILKALEPYDNETRRRILKATAVLLGLPTFTWD